MSTLPQLLLDQVGRTPQKVAWRQFRLGVWNESTWAAVHVEAAAIGSGLAALGLAKGDVVGILAVNSVTAIASEIGAQGIGCVAAVLSADLAPTTVRDLLDVLNAKTVIVGDQEQFDKVQAANLSAMQSTVVIDSRGFRHIELAGRPDADRVLTIEQLKDRSTSTSDWDSRAASVQAFDPAAILCVVNRSTREVEAHRYTHDGLVQHAEVLRTVAGAGARDIVSVQNSLADTIEHALSVVGPLTCGFAVNIGQADLSTQSMKQIQPTLVAMNTRWLSDAVALVEQKVTSGKGLKGFAARKGLVSRPLADKVAVARPITPSRIVGVVAAVLSFVFLLMSLSLNDFLRLAIVGLFGLVAALITVVTGWSAVSSARRALGFSRLRAVLHDGTISAEASPGIAGLLATLEVPAVALSSASSEILGRVRSEVLA